MSIAPVTQLIPWWVALRTPIPVLHHPGSSIFSVRLLPALIQVCGWSLHSELDLGSCNLVLLYVHREQQIQGDV